ncbi:MAG: MaoC family dehydratase [Deltaproteobacteria bacterium]|nr:MaoC family dehydratase [Deltaproteobacteria bacterium]
MKARQHVGKIAREKKVHIEHGLIERFVSALGIEDPLSSDPAAAQKAGLPGLMLPQMAAGSLGDLEAVVELLELKPKQVLHSEETVTVFTPLCIGEELNVVTRIREVYEQQVGGNPIGFCTVDVIGTNKKRAVLFEAQRTIAVRGGFPRR